MMSVHKAVIIDDSLDLCDAFADALTALGVESVTCATSLAELELRAASALACDLAIIDINLGFGEPTGLDVRRWLDEHGFSGKAVFLTGHAQSHPLVAATLEACRGAVLQKPIGIDVIRNLVEENGR